MSYKFDPNSNDIVGKGSFGTFVYKGTNDNRFVAIKVFPKVFDDVGKLSTLSDFESHINIVQIIKLNTTEDQKLFAVLDLYETNLEEFLQRKIDLNSAKTVTRQIVDGINYLHNLKIVHGNLCPSNVLLRNAPNGLVVAVSDFRLFEFMPSRWKEIARPSSTTFRTEWMAPEILLKLQIYEEEWTKQNDGIDINTVRKTYYNYDCSNYWLLIINWQQFFNRFYNLKDVFIGRVLCRMSYILHCYQPSPSFWSKTASRSQYIAE